MLTFLKIFLNVFVQVMSVLLFLYCVLSWFLPRDHVIRQKIDELVDPFLNPIRSVIPNVGMFDLSPLILMLILEFLGGILSKLL